MLWLESSTLLILLVHRLWFARTPSRDANKLLYNECIQKTVVSLLQPSYAKTLPPILVRLRCSTVTS